MPVLLYNSASDTLVRLGRGYELFRHTILRKNVALGLIEAVACKFKPRRDWFGKYAGQLPPETVEVQPAPAPSLT